VRIAFQDLDEWMVELEDYAKYAKGEHQNPVVRTTILTEGDSSQMGVYLACGFIVEDMMLHELVLFCGNDFKTARQEEGTETANANRAKAISSAEELGVRCLGGRYEYS
jgi:hypothetical protein